MIYHFKLNSVEHLLLIAQVTESRGEAQAEVEEWASWFIMENLLCEVENADWRES